jgi:hypothetical protein
LHEKRGLLQFSGAAFRGIGVSREFYAKNCVICSKTGLVDPSFFCGRYLAVAYLAIYAAVVERFVSFMANS